MHLFAFDCAYGGGVLCYYIKMRNNDIKIIAELVWHFTCAIMYLMRLCVYVLNYLSF